MTLAERLRAGEVLVTGWSAIPEPLVVEAVAGLEFDAVTLDMQHGGHDDASALRSVAPILAAGSHPVIRIPVGRFDLASRALDMGFEAVIAPMINSVADAEAFAKSMKYPPVGQRSWGPHRALGFHGKDGPKAYLRNANADTLAFAMIETREALEALDDILAVDGIDGVLVGPSDFSIAWTNGATMDPALEDMMPAIEEIAQAALGKGKLAAIYVIDAALCGRFVKMGYSFIAHGTEARYLSEGVGPMVAAVKKSIGQQG